MNIRCEKCSTTYELDEALLAPEGSPVQCTKCQHVFTAVPPRTAGRTLVGVPAAPAPAAPAPPRPTAPEGAGRQGPAIYRPSHAAPPASRATAPHARRDTMGAFEARLKAGARLRWIVPLAALLVVIGAVSGWFLLSSRVDPAAQRRHAEAMALAALDDLESLEKASRILDEIAARESGIDSLDADRALTQLLLATGQVEDVAGPAARLAAKTAERERLAAAQPPTPPEVLAGLGAEIEALRGQVEPRLGSARALAEKAYSALTKVSGERGNELPVARALAIHYASVGDREQALRFVRGAGPAAEKDPWIQLALGWLDAREEGKEPRERAVVKLTALVAAHPEVVRARFLLARTQAALGKREVAAATLDGLLAVNPRHGRASRLKAELVVPAPPAAPQRPAGGVPAIPVGAGVGAPQPRPLPVAAPAPVASPAQPPPRPPALAPAPLARPPGAAPGAVPAAAAPKPPIPPAVAPSGAAPAGGQAAQPPPRPSAAPAAPATGNAAGNAAPSSPPTPPPAPAPTPAKAEPPARPPPPPPQVEEPVGG